MSKRNNNKKLNSKKNFNHQNEFYISVIPTKTRYHYPLKNRIKTYIKMYI